jgi:cyanamide hydratase family protein with HD domain
MPFPATFDAFVPANFSDFLASANIQPNYVSFDTLNSFPFDIAQKASYEYAQRLLPKIGFLHVLRTYFYALVILFNGFPSGTPGVPQITFQELNTRLYHAAILHDLGWTPGPDSVTHPAHAMSFEIFGGIMAYDHLHAAAPALDAHQVGDIVQSIMLHTSGFEKGTSSAVGILLSLGANFDLIGFNFIGGSVFNRTTVQEIEAAFPRRQFGTYAKDVLNKELDDKPNCIISHYRGVSNNMRCFSSWTKQNIACWYQHHPGWSVGSGG